VIVVAKLNNYAILNSLLMLTIVTWRKFIQNKNQFKMNIQAYKNQIKGLKTNFVVVLTSILLIFSLQTASAHCDSYDGPVIKDAIEALENNNVDLVLKWITEEQESEITSLFNKTYALKDDDNEVYEIVEKHFFETLVRLHRETEGAPFTGLKPAGSTIQIIQMTDSALHEDDIEGFIIKLDNHLNTVVREKYQKVAELDKVKNNSKAEGRAFVEAYVDYTHTIAAIHNIIEHGAAHN
jgi:hypothetical protein